MNVMPPKKKKKPAAKKTVPRSSKPTWPWLSVPLLVVVAGLGYYMANHQTSSLTPVGVPSVVETGQPEVLEGKTASYRITVPNSNTWKRVPEVEDNSLDLAIAHTKSRAVVVVKVHWPLDNPFLTVNDLVQVWLAEAKANAPQARVIALVPLDPAGTSMLVRRANSSSGHEVEELTSFHVLDDQLFTVEAVVPANEFGGVQTEIDTILRSFVPPPRQAIPTALPAPPFDIAAPASPAAQYQQVDLRKADLLTIAATAMDAQRRNDDATALQLWHWAITRGFTHQMSELASIYGGLGQTDAAIYWLQQAANKESVDPFNVEGNPKFDSLRKDPRGPTVRSYVWNVSRYWAHHGQEATMAVVPKGYVPGTPIPVVVGLHGFGSMPSDFANEQLQRIADQHSIAFVSASGTISRGPSTYRWTESVEKDAQRIERALASVAGRVTAKPGKVILQGFSQGAQMSAEIAARYPERYAGAIVMSPGTRRNMGFHDVDKAPQLADRRFVVVVGAKEPPKNVAYAKRDAEILRSYGADVIHKEYSDQAAHAFPADYETAISKWIEWILRK